jgi:hypothetical protein
VNYTELKTNIQDICEQTFTDAQLAMFTEQAEQGIYNSVQIPALRRNQTGVLTNADPYLIYPVDFLYPFSLAVIDAQGNYEYLLNKDVNFMREAYPNPTSTGKPKHYGLFDDTAFIVGPSPDAAYTVELHYGYYPQTIVTAGTTLLGDEFDTALLNGALVQAIRFMKGDAEMVALYQQMYIDAMSLLKNLGDGKMREDMYRSGQLRIEPR